VISIISSSIEHSVRPALLSLYTSEVVLEVAIGFRYSSQPSINSLVLFFFSFFLTFKRENINTAGFVGHTADNKAQKERTARNSRPKTVFHYY
jgi:hypothetical protein